MSLKIDQALNTAVLGGGLGVDIVFENGLYSAWGGASYTNKKGVYLPQTDREYLEVRNFPASTKAFTVNDTAEQVGVYQGILRYPSDLGAITIKTKAEAFLALFGLDTPVAYDGQDVHVTAKTRDGGRTEGGFYQIVCRINYRAFLAY